MKENKKFNRLQQEQRDLDESYQQSKRNKKEHTVKEKTLNEELMEGFKKEQQELNDKEK